jgi:hypothetical protein
LPGDPAPGNQIIESVDRPEEGAFAATARPDHRDHAIARHAKGRPFDRLVRAVKNADATGFDQDIARADQVVWSGCGDAAGRRKVNLRGRRGARGLERNSAHTSFSLHGSPKCMNHSRWIKHFKKY